MRRKLFGATLWRVQHPNSVACSTVLVTGTQLSEMINYWKRRGPPAYVSSNYCVSTFSRGEIDENFLRCSSDTAAACSFTGLAQTRRVLFPNRLGGGDMKQCFVLTFDYKTKIWLSRDQFYINKIIYLAFHKFNVADTLLPLPLLCLKWILDTPLVCRICHVT